MTVTAAVNGTEDAHTVHDLVPTAPDVVDAERMLDAVGQAVMATGVYGSIIYWNAHAERMYGWTASEVIGRSVVDVVVPPDLHDSANDILRHPARVQMNSAGASLVMH